MTRFFGVREMGGWLLLAERSAESARRRSSGAVAYPSAATAQLVRGEQEVRRAIWLNVATDSMDALTLAAVFMQGSLMDGVVLVKILGAALVMVAAVLETAWAYP
ncbi:hypothetical protein N657DRAFT_646794 [Parathielavia appendiculata]|uniref:Uncharacterized protein n=1 Tax=Parathielavia appendiculata TaxID=2587402 RepID=A0AAN6TX33_9PEZI|nr:hypothetical protein N657DRAFT_646794 [Parathielavia appendiculata]